MALVGVGLWWMIGSNTFNVHSADAASLPGEGIFYIRDRNLIWIRGSISATKDVAQRYSWITTNNQKFDYNLTYIIDPSTPNTIGNYGKGRLVSSVTDDTAPIKTGNANYIMAGHGLVVPQVQSAGHDKTAADIGSVWESNGNRFVLMEISGDNLIFYPQPVAGGITAWSLPTAVGSSLTHVSGATNTRSILVGSVTRVQRYPITKNRVQQTLINGTTEMLDRQSGTADFVDFVEEFDLLDPSTINKDGGPLGWDSTDEVWMHVRNVYRATAGRTVLHATYEVRRPMYLMLAGMMQVSPLSTKYYDQVSYYIPKTKPISGFDFSKIQPLSGATGGDLYFDSEHITDAANPPNRQTIFLKRSTDENYDVAFAFGYSPFVDGTAEARARNCQQAGDRCWWLAVSKKTYPIAVGNVGLIDDVTYETYSYRQWVDQSAFDAGKTAYWHDVDGHKMLYVDYYTAQQNDLTELPSWSVGKEVKVVESANVVVNDYIVGQAGISLSVADGAESGFLVAELVEPLPAPVEPRLRVNRGDTLNIIIDETDLPDRQYAIDCGNNLYMNYSTHLCEPLHDSPDIWRTRADWGGDQGATQDGLQPSTSYTHRLRYRDGGRYSAFSSEALARTSAAVMVIKDSFSALASSTELSPWLLRSSTNTLDDGTNRPHFEFDGSKLVFRLVGGKDFHSLYRKFSNAQSYSVSDRTTVDFDLTPLSTQDKSEVRFSLVNSKGFSVSSAIGVSLQNVAGRWVAVARLTGKPGTTYKDSVLSRSVPLTESITTGATYHVEIIIESGVLKVTFSDLSGRVIGTVSQAVADASLYNTFDAFSINDYNTGRNSLNGIITNDLTLIEGGFDNLLITAEDL